MKKQFLLLLIIPTICFSQSEEVSKTENRKIGEYYDELNKEAFSLTKSEFNYDLCFLNKVTTNSESQMTCLTFNEPESSMFSFFNYVLKLFDSTEVSLDKEWETPRYRITIRKSGDFITLLAWDNYSRSLAVTSLISRENWKKLFGKV